MNFTASGGSFLYGTALGWSSSAGVKIHYEYDLDISLNQFAWSVSMLSLGAASTCVLSGIIRNRYGSKKTILLFSFPNIFGWSLLIFAQNALMVIKIKTIREHFRERYETFFIRR